MADEQSPPQIRTTSEAWESLFRTQVAVMRRMQQLPEFKKLAMREYDVLFNLSHCPTGWTRLNELNEALLISQPSLSRMVERLEAKGLVQRRTAERDQRGIEIALTEEGRALQQEIGRVHVRHLHEMLAPALNEEEFKQLQFLTDKLRTGLKDRLPSAAAGYQPCCTPAAGSVSGTKSSTTAVTFSSFRERLPPTVDRKAVSEESAPVETRTRAPVSESRVASSRCH